MNTMTVKFEVDPELASAYEVASEEDRLKAQALVELTLRDVFLTSQQEKRSRLIELMDKISAEAQAKGLTEEILQDILNDDSDD